MTRSRSAAPAPLLVTTLAAAVALLLGACTSSSKAKDDGATAPATATSSGTSSATSSGTSSSAATAVANWPTYNGTPDRAGNATAMPPASDKLAAVARIRLDGPVYASPLVVGGRTIVATENDTVYAFDRSYHQVWKRHLGTPSPQRERECGNIDPLGITGTPVYDATSGLLFVAAEYGGPPRHSLVALSPGDGRVRWSRSLDLPGVQTKAMQERGALAVSGGRVWVPFGGQAGDCGGYKGRLVGLRTDGTAGPESYTVPTKREAGIWTSPGPSVDAAGHLYVAVGNGAAGTGDAYDHSDSVLEVDANGRLLDSFSPRSWPTDNENDLDLGSQGPVLVGPWVIAVGKSGVAYVLRRARLGGIGGEVSSASVCKSFGGAAVSGDVVYLPCTDGVRAVRVDGSGRLHMLWHASSTISGSPVIGGGRVWTLDTAGGVLQALDPRTGRSVARSSVGATSRFAALAVAGRDVLVPTLAGITVVRTS